jgi:two-component system response regulator FlrC
MRVRYVLVADGERRFRMALFTALTRLGHGVEMAEDAQEALQKLQDQRFDMALVEAKLPKGGGLAVVRELKRLRPETAVIAMSSGGSVEEAVSFMREGARDYLVKPFPNGIVEEAVQRAAAAQEDDSEPPAGPQAAEGPGERPIIYRGPVMGRLLALAVSLAGSAATVLLQGESGTGKELLARFIHQSSARRDGPFVAVNCAGLPESLLESELFGHEKGAFTGALAKKPGKFDLASGGTLLLDEISEMDLSLQAKLLRALQEGEIDPVGGKGPHKIDVRVIATTNRKLKEWVDAGKFRSDLYYRLNVMPFYIPSLRERPEDVEALALHFIDKHAALSRKRVAGISGEAMALLKAHDWPGNVRELENAVARAVLMAMGETIEAHDVFMDEAGFMAALEKNADRLGRPPLSAEAALAPAKGPEARRASAEAAPDGGAESLEGEVPLMTITEMERCLIGKALQETSGNRTHAARLLGISVRTLRNKLAEYRGEAGAGDGDGAPPEAMEAASLEGTEAMAV